MSKISLGKYKKQSKNSKLVVYEKVKKKIHTRSNFVAVFASKFRCSVRVNCTIYLSTKKTLKGNQGFVLFMW